MKLNKMKMVDSRQQTHILAIACQETRGVDDLKLNIMGQQSSMVRTVVRTFPFVGHVKTFSSWQQDLYAKAKVMSSCFKIS